MAQKTPWPALVFALVVALVLLGSIGAFVFGSGASPKKTGSWGFVDSNGEVVLPARYDKVRGFEGGRAAASVDGAWGLIDKEGTWLVQPTFLWLCNPAPLTCAHDRDTQQWGYIDAKGAWVIPPQYDLAFPFDEGVAVVAKTSPLTKTAGKEILNYGLIDTTGQARVPIFSDGDPNAWGQARPGSDGLIPVEQGGRWGYVDSQGDWAIAPTFKTAKPFREDFAGVSNGLWFVIDAAGKPLVQPGHGLADGASEGLISGPDGYYTLEGEPVGARYKWVRPHSSGLGAVFDNQRWGFVDTKGNVAIPLTFNRVSAFDSDVATAAELKENRFQWGIIGREGHWRSEKRWSQVDETGFHEGLWAVENP